MIIRFTPRIFWFFLLVSMIFVAGCKTASDHRIEADTAASKIIDQKMRELFCRDEQFSINRPSNILRRRLLIDQRLSYSDGASLGVDQLSEIEHWPKDDNYDGNTEVLDPLDVLMVFENENLKLTLTDALMVGAQNNFDYQKLKEDIFKAALDLDLTRNDFRYIFQSQVKNNMTYDLTNERAKAGMVNDGSLGINKKFESGLSLTSNIAIDLANLLTLDKASAFGIKGDASFSIPLLRGSGKHIVTEPLTQAQRNVVYAMYNFERYKQTYAVRIAKDYLAVLRLLDELKNVEENYKGLQDSAKRAKMRAEAGRLTEIEFDQAVQDELRAKNRLVSAEENYKRRIDSFKILLGLAPDSRIELDHSELQKLSTYADKFADADSIGPLEINPVDAIDIAFANRYDMRITKGRVYDSQRDIVILADALGAELTLLGSANLGGSKGLGGVNTENADLRTDMGYYSSLLTIDLPFERTAERNNYRKGYIALEQVVRSYQEIEDQIKINIRSRLGDLAESRQSVGIQAMSVKLAQKRVSSTNMFMEAGRAVIRDQLEAQESLLAAKNALTSAVINYRVAELELQLEMGVLEVDSQGIWYEFIN